jgi:DNA-directed RNA polymerase subunit RPC12/RpoP
MDVSVEIHCGTCGSANYSMPEGESDQAAVVCNDCGVRLGSIAELKTELLEQATAHSAEALRKELDRFVQGLSDKAA